jgi:phage terminase small subunit
VPQLKLTAKQRAFIDHYVVTKNATRSAILAGYSKKTADTIGKENLRKPQIKKEIETRLAQTAERVKVTGDQVLNELRAIGMFRLSDVVSVEKDVNESGNPTKYANIKETDEWTDDAHRAIESVKINAKGEIEVKAHSKVAALKQLGDSLGLFKDFDTLVAGLMQYGVVTWLEDKKGFQFRFPES